MTAIHVLIADDSREFRQGLRKSLARKEDIEVVGEAADGPAAVSQAGAERPEVVVMDIEMPGLDGIEATRQIRARWPAVQVVPLSIYDRPVFREAMAEAGAVGYVVKNGELEELLAAIREAAAPRGRDGDGHLDIVIAARGGDDTYIGYGSGDATFEWQYLTHGDNCCGNGEVHFGRVFDPPEPACVDNDGDGWGDPESADCPSGPENVDTCDAQDNNCDTFIDEGTPDGDGDGVCDAIDNCALDANPLQENCDGDEYGDVCDIHDTDEDGLTDAQEINFAGGVCPGGCPDPRVGDTDGDGLLDGFESDADPDRNCDFCSADTDLDGVLDAVDPFCNDPAGTEEKAIVLDTIEDFLFLLENGYCG